MDRILSLDKISAGYGKRKVLHEISFHADRGEKIMLIGANGCGKTTLLKVIVGILRPYSGGLYFMDKNILSLPIHLRIQKGIGYLKQTGNIFPSLTVLENIKMSFWDIHKSFTSRFEWLLTIFPILRDKLEFRAGLLSGGERQALAISMVLIRPIELLILDEPTAGLSPKTAAIILESIHRAQQSTDLTSIVVEHNLRLLRTWVSRVLVMKQGRLVAEENQPSSLLNSEKLHRFYF